MNLYLASSSPRRKEILTKAGFSFIVEASNAIETIDNNLSVYENVVRLAHIKAEPIFNKHKDSVVLGCDTIVVYKDRIYGKPKSEKDAFNTLKMLSNNTHKVLSGVSIRVMDKEYSFYVESKVTFKDLTDNDILDYIATGEPTGKAGSYAIQGKGMSLVKEYSGSLNNIIGLPIEKIKPILESVLK